jgi:DNA-binding protein HU-beta
LSQNRRSVRVFVGPANDRLSGGEAVTKQEFVDAVAHKTSMSKRDAAAAVDAFLDTVEGALRAGDPVAFTGFGKFHVTHRAAREGVNPRNPTQKVHIPAANVPKFSAGSQLKKAVN